MPKSAINFVLFNICYMIMLVQFSSLKKILLHFIALVLASVLSVWAAFSSRYCRKGGTGGQFWPSFECDPNTAVLGLVLTGLLWLYYVMINWIEHDDNDDDDDEDSSEEPAVVSAISKARYQGFNQLTSIIGLIMFVGLVPLVATLQNNSQAVVLSNILTMWVNTTPETLKTRIEIDHAHALKMTLFKEKGAQTPNTRSLSRPAANPDPDPPSSEP